MYDVIIIGGGYAGLSAALQLARTRRSILVIDHGLRRNRFAATSHGFLGQDGRAPGEIIDEARAQLFRYPTVDWLEDRVEQAEGSADDFRVITVENGEKTGRRLVLALGVKDELPAIPGLEERWGRSVFHCPYCHG